MSLLAALFRIFWLVWCFYLTAGAVLSYVYLGRILRRQPHDAARMTALILILQRGQQRRVVRSISLAIAGAIIWSVFPGNTYVTTLGLVFLVSIVDESYSFFADNRGWKVIEGATQE